MAKFYLVKDGQRMGPLSIEQLVNEGLTPESLMRNDGMTDWSPAGQVAELASVFAQTAQPVWRIA